jgi:hypothetical protein
MKPMPDSRELESGGAVTDRTKKYGSPEKKSDFSIIISA